MQPMSLILDGEPLKCVDAGNGVYIPVGLIIFSPLSLPTLRGVGLPSGPPIHLHHGLHGLRGEVLEVDQAVVRADLEVLAGVLVDVGRAEDAEDLAPGGEHDGAAEINACRVGDRADLFHRVPEEDDVIATHANPQLDVL